MASPQRSCNVANWEEPTESATFLALTVGAGACAAVLALAPLTAPVFGEDVADLARLTAPFFLLAGASAVSQALLQRELRFRRLGVIEALGAITGSVTSVLLALTGLGAPALVLGVLAGATLSATLSLASAWPPAPRRHRRELGDLLRFAAPNMASSASFIGSNNLDYAVLSTQVSAATVGLYWRGFQLGVDGQRKISEVLARLVFPLYARARDAEQLLALRFRVVRLQTMVIVPALGALILLAPELVPLVFGERWTGAVLPAQILALAGMLKAAQAGIGPLIAVLGRPGVALRWNLATAVALVVVVFAAAPYGLTTLCAAVVALRLARFLSGHYFLLQRIAGIPMRHVWLDGGPAVAATATMVVALGALRALVLEPALPALATSLTVAALTAPAYLLALRALFPSAHAELASALRRLLTGRREGAAHEPGRPLPKTRAPAT